MQQLLTFKFEEWRMRIGNEHEIYVLEFRSKSFLILWNLSHSIET